MAAAAVFDALRQDLADEATALGFVAFGIADAAAEPQWAERLAAWVDAGNHGTMAWMANRQAQRANPQALWPEAQRVIALGMSYAPATDALALAARPGHGRISAYARGADYHAVLKKALKALARWLIAEARQRGLGQAQVKVFVDTAPVMEKPLSAAAGLGWQGKHSNLVSREHGSWLFLGAIYTDLPLPLGQAEAARCGSCEACLTACPTDAFPAPGVIDARRCLSYWTIEHDGPIPLDLREALGNRIYGCDDCLAACPWNKFAQAAAANAAFLPRAELAAPRLADLLTLDEAGFRRLFAGSPIKRIGRDRLIRNCLIAAGNSRDPGLCESVSCLLNDPSPMVAEAARWAAERLRQAP